MGGAGCVPIRWGLEGCGPGDTQGVWSGGCGLVEGGVVLLEGAWPPFKDTWLLLKGA